jgi:hypothetical protein
MSRRYSQILRKTWLLCLLMFQEEVKRKGAVFKCSTHTSHNRQAGEEISDELVCDAYHHCLPSIGATERLQDKIAFDNPTAEGRTASASILIDHHYPLYYGLSGW